MTRLVIALRITQVVSLKLKDIKVTHCPSTGVCTVRMTKLGRKALYCCLVTAVVLCFIPFIKWE